MPGPTPRVVEMSERFRRQLLARERAAATGLVRYYGETWRRLQEEIAGLEADVAILREAGRDVGEGALWELERMRSVQRQVEEELARFAQFADGEITAGMREAIAAGERNARDLLEGMYPPGTVDVQFGRMSREAVEALAGFLADGSPLRDLLTAALGEAADKFGGALVSALARGLNPREIARELRDAFGMGLTRALRIARTEMLRAWRTASLRSYRQSGLVTEWERCAAHSTRTCLACLLLDGRRYKLEQEMEDHVNGRCCVLPVTKSYKDMGIDAPEPDFTREMGRDWFLALPEMDQREIMGDGRYDAWKDGQFDLDDVPHRVYDPVWGGAWVPRPLYDLLGEDGPVGTYAAWKAGREN